MTNQSESILELAKALCKAQAEMPSAKKDEVNPFFKSRYAGLAGVMQSALPVLSKHGLAVSQLVSSIDGASSLTTILMHESGQFISATMPLLLKANDPQGQGSAITYARRYAFMSAIGMVADEDDDGHAASKPEERPAPTTSTLATEAQIKMIKSLLGTRIAMFEASKGKVEEMSKYQASKLIEALKEKQETVQSEPDEQVELDMNNPPF